MKTTDLWPMGRLALAASVDRRRAWGKRIERKSLAWTEPTVELVSDAVRLGVRFLESTQSANGSFRGFQLTPGASVEWITAHVALVTEGVSELAVPRRRAAAYLLSVGPLD